MSYYKKYLKYKNKYLRLKNNFEQIGGGVFKIIKYPDGNKYKGYMKNGKKHGKGTFIYANGDKYKGNFKNDMMYGDGIFTYIDGRIHQGEYKDNMQNGDGTLIFADRTKYEGNFKDNMFHGKGKYTDINGNVYEGEFKNDMKDGRGIFTYIDGSIHQGEYKDNMRNGKGTLIFANKTKYEGNFKNDMIDREGKYTDINGNVYEGEFKDNMYNGEGKYTDINGNVYEGEFKNNMFHGKGKFTYIDGNVYEGEFKDNMKDGWGIFTYIDGDVYEGEMKDNMRNGEGQLVQVINNTVTKRLYKKIYIGTFLNNITDIGIYNYTDDEDKIILSIKYINPKYFTELIQPPKPIIDQETYEIVILICGHGCDIKNRPLTNFLNFIEPENKDRFKYSHFPQTYHGHLNFSWADENINNIYNIFNSDESKDKETKLQIREYIADILKMQEIMYSEILFKSKNQYGLKHYGMPKIYKDGTSSIDNRPGINRLFHFNEKMKPTPTYGVFIFKNNIGLHNNINLFDYTNLENFGVQKLESELSRALVDEMTKLQKENIISLSSILYVFHNWFISKFPSNKKLNINIIDLGCRVICDPESFNKLNDREQSIPPPSLFLEPSVSYKESSSSYYDDYPELKDSDP